jgi:hypothetical protein
MKRRQNKVLSLDTPFGSPILERKGSIMTEEQHKTSRIPEFASREEEAEFWDTLDLTDFEDEFKPVQVKVAEKLGAHITIDLDHEAWHKLLSAARQKGVSPIALARTWIMERLEEPQS